MNEASRIKDEASRIKEVKKLIESYRIAVMRYESAFVMNHTASIVRMEKAMHEAEHDLITAIFAIPSPTQAKV